jgi:hypothetical protein
MNGELGTKDSEFAYLVEGPPYGWLVAWQSGRQVIFLGAK